MELEKEKVRKAVAALVKLVQKTEKSQLIDEDVAISVQFAFRKIPDIENKTIHLKLPHSLHQRNRDVCLFVKDLSKNERDYEPSVRHYKERLDKHGVTEIAEVIPLKCLRLEHKQFEAKRVLSNRFDVFLADKGIIRLLPKLLGKAFYSRRRLPVGVNLDAKDLRKEIQKALDNSRCHITGRGSCYRTTVANTGMSVDNIVDNVIATADQLAAEIPGGPLNMKNLYIKSSESMSIPLYLCTDTCDVELPVVEKKVRDIEAEEVTTLIGAKVKVTPHGHVKVIRDKRKARDSDADLDSVPAKKKKANKPKQMMKSQKAKKQTKVSHKLAGRKKSIKQPPKRKI